MTGRAVVTEHESQEPWLFVRLVDGLVDVLHLDRLPDGADARDAALRSVQRSLTDAIRRHHEAQVEALGLGADDEAGPDERAVMAFTMERLREAAGAEPIPPPLVYPVQADGRDSSGEVHVSVGAEAVLILDVPASSTADHDLTGRRIAEALNLALSRLAADTLEYAERWREDPGPPTDWAALAAEIDLLREQ